MVLAATEPSRYSPVGKSSRSEPLVITEFAGGLNNVSDITTLRDDELYRMENFELDANGTLVSRPPIEQVAGSPVSGETIDLHGYFVDSNGDINLVVSCASGTYLYDVEAETYTQITSIVASGAAQYGDDLYVCSATQAGGYYNGTTFIQLNSGAQPMPKGEQIFLYKSRLFMVSRETSSNKTRIYFSDITTAGPSPTSINDWDPNNYFNLPGDGETITAISPSTNEIFIFRTKSTYYFRYTVEPADGALEVLSNTVGADNKYSVAEYEFSYLILNNGRLYRFISYQFYPLNDIQRLTFQQSANTLDLELFSALTVFGRRALVWYGGSLYALDLEIGTWSEWKSPTTYFAWGLLVPRKQDDLTPDTVLGISGLNTESLRVLYKSIDAYGQDITEEITCIAETKAFDFQTPNSWKRLFYWAADVYTARDIVGVADPIAYSGFVSLWDDFEDGTWDDLEDGTWDNPLSPDPSVTTTVDYTIGLPYRLTATFQKDMRFRRCSFKLQLTTDGTTSTGPVKVASLAIHAVGKKGVSGILE